MSDLPRVKTVRQSKKVTPSIPVSRARKKLPVQSKKSKTKVASEAKLGTRITVKSEKTTNKKITITDNSRIGSASASTSSYTDLQEVSGSITPSYRLPVIQPSQLSLVARTAGLFFVFAGGFLTLSNLNSGLGILSSAHIPHTATLVTTSITSSSDLNETHNETISTPDSDSIDTTPDVRVVTESTTLKNAAPVSIIVPYATTVKLIAYNKSTHTDQALGTALQVDGSTWKYVWETKKYTNGEYRLRIEVQNQYGNYIEENSNTYTIQNDTQSELSSEPPLTIVEEDVVSTSTVSVTEQIVTLAVPRSSSIKGIVDITVEALSAEEVKVYAKNTLSSQVYYVGTGVQQDSGTWNVSWNSRTVTNGDYVVYAYARFSDKKIESSRVRATVSNDLVTVVSPNIVRISSTTTEEEKDTPLKPSVQLEFSKENPLTNSVDVYVTTQNASRIELFAIPKNALTPFFLGYAKKVSENSWKYSWRTNETPNGEYDVYVKITSSFGSVDSEKTSVRIKNDIQTSYTTLQEQKIDVLHDIGKSLSYEIDTESTDTSAAPKEQTVYVKPVRYLVSDLEIDDETVQNEIESELITYRGLLNTELNNLAKAIRVNDTEAATAARVRIENIRQEISQSVSTREYDAAVIDTVTAYVEKVTNDLEDLTYKNESVLKERIGDAITVDSDKDGISDYDEVHLYKTNPFAADTDGDSYIDGAEIAKGFDPHDSTSETLIVYESPKDTGIVREDLLAVSSITTLTRETNDSEASLPIQAIISGKGLPNSFVTLYIYSTPVVVTVKTDEDGSWMYIFDKDIEDGDHEVYVGITDNEGRVVAKSNPLPFVKTAEAYAEASPTVPQKIEEVEPSLLEKNNLLLVAALAIVSLGLVLILLGVYISKRQMVPVVAPV